MLVAQTYVLADYDEVWAHLTEADRYSAWSSAPGLTFGHTPGARVSWGASEADPVYSGVLRTFEPGRGFSHTMAFGFVSPAEDSLVHWDVAPQGPVVWVRVRHDCAEAPQTRAIISEVGWVKSLARLKTLLETGTAMPWPEAP